MGVGAPSVHTHLIYLSQARAERVFSCQLMTPATLVTAHWRFTLTPDGDGTVLSQWVQVGPGESGITELIEAMPDKESRILRRRLAEHHANMVATLAGIKKLAEAD